MQFYTAERESFTCFQQVADGVRENAVSGWDVKKIGHESDTYYYIH